MLYRNPDSGAARNKFANANLNVPAAFNFSEAKIITLRYLLNKIRTYFEQNPDADF
jgi:hypothetical protein